MRTRILFIVTLALLVWDSWAHAGVTLTVREQVVAQGRFVRIGDIAGLDGTPEAVARLARVVVSEAPAGREAFDLRRGDIERRLAEVGMRGDVSFAGAQRVRVYAPGAIDLQEAPLYDSAAFGRLPATASALATITPTVSGVATPAPASVELLPGLRDIEVSERVANAQFQPAAERTVPHPPEESRARVRPAAALAMATGGPVPSAPAPAFAAPSRPYRDANDYPICVDLSRPAPGNPVAPAASAEDYVAGGPRPTGFRAANTADNGVVPAAPAPIPPVVSARTGVNGAGPSVYYAGEEAPGLDLFGSYTAPHPTAKQTRLWHVPAERGVDGADASRVDRTEKSVGGSPDPAARPAAAEDPATREALETAIGKYYADSCEALRGSPVVSLRKGAEGLPRGLSWTVGSMVSGKIPGAGRFQLEAVGPDGQPVTARVDADTAIEAPVLLLRRACMKDDPIRAADVYTERRRVDPAAGWLTDPAQLVGHAAAKNLSAAKPLTLTDLVKPLWVKRRGLVKIQVATGLFNIECSGIALEDGRGGDTITVQDGDKKNVKHFVQITGPGEGTYVGRAE